MNLSFESPIGKLWIQHNGQAVTALQFELLENTSGKTSPEKVTARPVARNEATQSRVDVWIATRSKARLAMTGEQIPTKDTWNQAILTYLTNYFRGVKSPMTLPLQAEGSPFQKKVWVYLTQIELGETMTYGALAESLQSHPRAIAQACKSNPIALVIPCHRVVAQNGLGGFMGAESGQPVKIKEWLLLHEKNMRAEAETGHAHA